MKECTPLWREAHFQVKMYKAHQRRSTFGSCDVEKVHTVGAKHIWKSKCTKHISVGPFLEVDMSKKRTPLSPKAHFKVKSLDGLGALLEVEMSKRCTPLWREAHFEVKSVKN